VSGAVDECCGRSEHLARPIRRRATQMQPTTHGVTSVLENEIFDDRTDDRTSIEECAAGAQVLLNAVLEYDRRQR